MHCVTPMVRAAAAMLCTSLLAACSTDAPLAPAVTEVAATSPYDAMAFSASVNLRTRTVTVTPPPKGRTTSPKASLAGSDAVSLSLLGSDVIGLVPSNVRISRVGAFAPNKVRVTFDVAMDIRLPTLALTVPSWPTPPVPQVILFPITGVTTVTPGSATGIDGNTVEVTQPSRGVVAPSLDWNGTGAAGSGAPYNFFTSAPCTEEASADCFRWVAFGPRLEPGGPRITRTIGFDMDATVAQFRTRMIVAADLAPAALPAP
jgi:hypothetical protein